MKQGEKLSDEPDVYDASQNPGIQRTILYGVFPPGQLATPADYLARAVSTLVDAESGVTSGERYPDNLKKGGLPPFFSYQRVKRFYRFPSCWVSGMIYPIMKWSESRLRKHRELRAVRGIFMGLVKKLRIKSSVVLRFKRRMPVNSGEEWRDDDGNIVIVINSSESYKSMIDDLIHELAHAYRDDRGDLRYGHSAEWGEAYAAVYRAYLEHVFGEKE